jgi:lauroyl/myristoyl acyltransferase
VEDRFLAERVTYAPGAMLGALRHLRGRLAENRVVSITAGRAARRAVLAPFLAAAIKLPPRAAKLALGAGAPLLPVATLRAAAGRFRVEIGAPLVAHGAPEPAALCALYARWIEPRVRACPGQWLGWRTVISLPEAGLQT